MIIVTGGAGFIGSALVAALNSRGIEDILIVDVLGRDQRWRNLNGRRFVDYLHKDRFLSSLSAARMKDIKAIVHLGASASTTETDVDMLMENNTRYTLALCDYALSNKIRFIYASSAATYGDGSQGYSDEHASAPKLLPLNPYGFSKQMADLAVLRNKAENRVVGLKFFNVFGPREAHKGDMRSMVLRAYEQIKETGKVRLFKSYRADYKDGEQKRDFVYVKDCCEVMLWLLDNPRVNGIFNLGTGQARSWNDLAKAVFGALGLAPAIEYIEMPLELRSQYQYFTEANMGKLRAAGCSTKFLSLEEAIRDYVVNHLEPARRAAG